MTDAPEAPRQEREALRLALVKGYEDNGLHFADTADDLLAAGYVTPEAHAAALAASQADAARLRDVLKLFAERAERYDDTPYAVIGDTVGLWQIDANPGMRVDLTVGDLRRARDALAASQPQGEGDVTEPAETQHVPAPMLPEDRP
jgi:hypothetical protein